MNVTRLFARVAEWSAMHGVALLVAVVLLALLVLALLLVLVTMRQVPQGGDARAGNGSSPRRVSRHELEFILDFISELSRLLSELEQQSELRRLPEILCQCTVRMFKAEQAIVLVRRRRDSTRPGSESRLIVAAMASPEHGIRMGSEIPMGVGHLGTVAQCQRVLDRRDFERHHDTDAGSWPMFGVAAPMVANERTLGVIAFSRPHRHHPRAKEILNMVAQLGAMTWTNISAYRNVKMAAEVDELTGIYNKRSLHFRLSELLYEARMQHQPVSVYLFDIDNFKHYNDSNGHLAGDHLLRALAQLVRETVRTDDVFGRFGGEEFMLLLPGRSRQEALAAAENIRLRIASHNFAHGEGQPLGCLSVSGGVATFPEDGGDALEVVEAADQALYRAKDGGRNQTCVAQTGVNPQWHDEES